MSLLNPGGRITVRRLRKGDDTDIVRIANSAIGHHRVKGVWFTRRGNKVSFEIPREHRRAVVNALARAGHISWLDAYTRGEI